MIKVIDSVFEDSSILLPIHKDAFFDYQNVKLGSIYIRKFIQYFIKSEDAICFTAFSDGEIMGYVCGAPIGYNQDMVKKLWFPAFIGVITNPKLIFDVQIIHTIKLKISSFIHPKSMKKELNLPTGIGVSLVSICTKRNSGIKGVGTELIIQFEKKARQRQFDFMRLSVKKENKSAIHFYENNGWQYLSDSSSEVIYLYKNI